MFLLQTRLFEVMFEFVIAYDVAIAYLIKPKFETVLIGDVAKIWYLNQYSVYMHILLQVES